MPQMGESIAEGTIVRWIKKVGDTVDRDEPLFEISTDKVDAEIPSPAAGVISEIRAKEGETVAVNSVVAVIGEAGAKPAAARRGSDACSTADAPPRGAACRRHLPLPATEQRCTRRANVSAAAAPAAVVRVRALNSAARDATRSSPLVRKIAKEHNVDITQIHGTGISGRVTKDDILAFIGGGPQPATPAAVAAGMRGRNRRPHLRRVKRRRTPLRQRRVPRRAAGLAGQVEPMSVMRTQDRRAHGREPTDIGARALGVRGELWRKSRRFVEAKKSGVRTRGCEAHLSLVHPQGGGRCAARGASRQRVGRRRQHRLPPGREHRHCRRARLGTDRAGRSRMPTRKICSG